MKSPTLPKRRVDPACQPRMTCSCCLDALMPGGMGRRQFLSVGASLGLAFLLPT
jgi:hypothetical protein